SGITYKEPPIPSPGVEQQEPTKETTDTELPSTKDIKPPLVQVQVQVQEDKPIEKPSVVIPKAKANIPYPSRLAKERFVKKTTFLPQIHGNLSRLSFRIKFCRCSCAYAKIRINVQEESKSRQEEIDVVTITDDVLPPSVENEDSDEEVDAVVDLRVDNFSKILSMSILRVRIPTLIIRQFHYHLRNHQMKNLILRLILQKKFLL
nr:hypothetical protein [Tanacetum cinerariifolium]